MTHDIYQINLYDTNTIKRGMEKQLSKTIFESAYIVHLCGGIDEPTTGLDPQTRKMIWSIIQDLRVKEGLTVFLTTHYMEEAAEADYVVIIDHGKIVAEGTPYELKNAYVKDTVLL